MERNTAKRTLEKLLSVCICLCMLGAMLPAQVFAEEADTAQTETVQDTAPKDTVYLSSADDLIQLAKNCRLDSWSQNRTVVLEADIDLSSVDFNGIPSFGGTWEGQNHAITGLSLSQDGSVQGLFRYVQQGALVRDMTVKGRIKPGGTRASVGGIAGSNAGTLHNCRFEGVSSGASLGAALAESGAKWLLIPLSMLLGWFIISAEPAVGVLEKQIEDVSAGAIPGETIKASLSVAIALAMAFSMLRVVTGISLLWFIVPGYALALILSFFVPDIYTAIAFDSGGVASGPMTATFMLQFMMGTSIALGGDVLCDAFGVVALVAMMPLLSIQAVGFYYEHIAKRPQEEAAVYGDYDIIELWEASA